MTISRKNSPKFHTELLNKLYNTSYLNGNNAPFIENLYETYLNTPESITQQWKTFFDNLQNSSTQIQHSQIIEQLRQEKEQIISNKHQLTEFSKQNNIMHLIRAFRVHGHLESHLDPISYMSRIPVPDLQPQSHGFSESDMDSVFNTFPLVAPPRLSLHNIVTLLRGVYCGPIGTEYMHITDANQKKWIQKRLEGAWPWKPFASEDQKTILEQLTHAEGLEKYLHTKYVGQKRFSLEGAESIIPLLHNLIQQSGIDGIKEIVIGMAHRGRLNVLINILGKTPRELFHEFEDKHDTEQNLLTGDVKYHLGFSSEIETPGGPVHLALARNPSHLEIINPVVMGSVRARQQRRGDFTRKQVMAVLIHGDAAFAGQGVVMEGFNMSQARGFFIGGAIHIIINNQIGFTTSNPMDSRSTFYCTEVAKMVQAPIFHVNADKPEAVLRATKIAMDFRKEFRKDVVIDLVCYRRHGHNEADEPYVTQPMMYSAIKKTSTTRTKYEKKLIGEGVITKQNATQMITDYRKTLESGQAVVSSDKKNDSTGQQTAWHPFLGTAWDISGDTAWDEPVDTTISLDDIRIFSETLLTLPKRFDVHPRVAKILDDRRKMAAGSIPIDWGFAETMAYASLLRDNYQIRLTGQDSGRGTFFHRHATILNQKTGEVYTPLEHIFPNQPRFLVINSLLSEEAVLAYEYGYSSSEPNALVIWEAQFGDFANGAQVVIDQFISSAEAKWGRLSGLVLFLPHGYEGQGPEHSSARLERFLQLCACNNMQVCYPTTPAQMFHMLRRQVYRHHRKPLVVMSPKSLLRHKLSISTLENLTRDKFYTIIPEKGRVHPQKATRLILCSGKVYFDLISKREEMNIKDLPIIRIEQLFPFPTKRLKEEIARYPNVKKVVWCQEEPQNQGAWHQTRHYFHECMHPDQILLYAGRPQSPSPAVGYFSYYIQQQKELVNDALFYGNEEDKEKNICPLK